MIAWEYGPIAAGAPANTVQQQISCLRDDVPWVETIERELWVWGFDIAGRVVWSNAAAAPT